MASACHNTKETADNKLELSIIPQPVKVQLMPDYFTISNSTIVYCNSQDLLPLTGYLNDKIKGPLGFSLEVREGFGNGINLRISDTEDESLGEEGYRLQVTPKNIEIVANRANGIFYGIQTLLQMLPSQIKSTTIQEDVDWKISCAEIEDEPRFPWRGLMLDVSRHYFTKDEVKAYIDQLSQYKMNVFSYFAFCLFRDSKFS